MDKKSEHISQGRAPPAVPATWVLNRWKTETRGLAQAQEVKPAKLSKTLCPFKNSSDKNKLLYTRSADSKRAKLKMTIL